MTKFTRILIAGLGIGIITHAASDAITPPPACPTVTETTTACPTTCTFPICAILSTLTAHCGCPDPAPTVSATFRCAPRDRCLPFPPPCPTLYTVRRITDCAGPTPPPLSSSYPISSSLTCSTGSSMISSGPPPSSTESMSSSTSITTISSLSTSSSVLSSSGSVPPLSQSENTTATATTSTSSMTSSAPPVETSTPAEPGTIGSSTIAPSPTVPTSPPSPGPSESRGERRVKTPFWMWWLF